MKPALISLDIDQTLIDFDRVLREALAETARWMGDKLGFEVTAEALQAARNRVAARPGNETAPMLVLRRAGFLDALGPGREAEADAALAVFKEARFQRSYLMPGAREVLEELCEVVPLAALSNGNSDPDRVGLGGLFSHVHLEGHAGFVKPDARAFQALYDEAGVTAAVCLHVGDSFDHDVRGAAGVGAGAIWLNPEGVEAPDDTPHVAIATLYDLPQVVAGWAG